MKIKWVEIHKVLKTLPEYVFCAHWGRTSSIIWPKASQRQGPGRLQSMGSLRVGHDWATSLHFGFGACSVCPLFPYLGGTGLSTYSEETASPHPHPAAATNCCWLGCRSECAGGGRRGKDEDASVTRGRNWWEEWNVRERASRVSRTEISKQENNVPTSFQPDYWGENHFIKVTLLFVYCFHPP